MNKRLLWLVAAVFAWWTLNGIAVGTQWMLMRDANGVGVPFWHAMPASMIGAWGWAPFALGLVWLAFRFPILPGRDSRGIAVHGAAIAAIVLLRAVFIYTLDPWLHWYDEPPLFAEVLLQSFWNNVFQSSLFVGVAHALVFAERARERERHAAQLQSQLADARLSALSSQLNPHFLFNALNSIAELVHRDAVAADGMIVGLSALLRSSLETGRNQEVPLEEELRLLGYYLDIERIRLGERLRVEWAIAPEASAALLPPLLLQPLVENAVRHGISRRLTPGTISVRAVRDGALLRLEVHDDGAGMPGASGGFGIGLATTRERLEALYGADGQLELLAAPEGGTVARLSLPYRSLREGRLMQRLRAVVVDDEPLARARLRRLLAQHAEVDVVAECGSGEESIAAFQELKPDVAFLDIRMPDMDGFDVLDALGPSRPPQVVFVTAYSEHAVRAFEARALDYLLKPVSAERLRLAVDRLNSPRVALPAAPAYPDRLAVPIGGRIHLVETAEIDHVDAHANYVELHLGARSLVLRETMTHLESRLDPKRFLRVHRSRLVRLDGILEAQAHASGRYLLRLKCGARLVTGRSYSTRVRNALGVD